jgi:predicted RND superfamily exporter protein
MRKGLSKHDAIVESMRVNLQPVFLTSLTTAIGFLSMNFSDAPPFWDLGNITAIGVTAAFAYAVLTLPALMAVLPIRVRAASGSSARARLMQWVGDFVVARRRVLLLGSGLATLVLGGLVPLNELNDDFVDYFDERVAFRRDTDFTSENLTGIYALEFSLSSGETDGITTPAYLEAVDHFADWYGEQPGVVHVASFSQVMKRLNRSMNGDDASFYRVPGRRDLAAQYLLLYELSLPYGLDLNNQINVAKSATRFVVTVENVTSRELRELAAAGEAWLRSNAPPSMHATASSASLMFSHISERNIRGMLGGTLLAFVLVTVVLVLALRSVGFGLISLIPNVVPAVLAFGLWGVTVGRVNIGLSVVVAMTMGIVVDDTVHFLSKYLRARRERGLGPQDAVRYAFTSVGSALVFTSLVLAVGFGVLAYSAFDLNAGMGKLTALTIALALIADFLLLPPLLMRLEEWRERVPGAALVLGAEARAEVGGAD